MIKFSLACSDGHQFEGWFSNSDSFETQKQEAAIECPICHSRQVDKALMRPAVATSRKREAKLLAAKQETLRLAAHVGEAERIEALRKLRNHLTENAENVGDRFAEEARKIHYDEAEKRGIYGGATSEEVKALAEEGIEFHPLPVLPEDQN